MRVRDRLPTPSLVEQHDVVLLGVEQTSMFGRDAATWTTMQKNRGFATRVTTSFKIDFVTIANVAHAGLVRSNRRVKSAESYHLRIVGQVFFAIKAATLNRRRKAFQKTPQNKQYVPDFTNFFG